MRIFPKISMHEIIRAHLDTLVDYPTDRVSRSDYFLFFGIPTIISLIIILFDNNISNEFSSLLITVHSIFSALLLNLLLTVYEMAQKKEDPANNRKCTIRVSLIKQVYANIAFDIFISLLSIISILLWKFLFNLGMGSNIISDIFYYISFPILFLSYFLTGVFILTLLMVLKRTYALLDYDAQQQ